MSKLLIADLQQNTEKNIDRASQSEILGGTNCTSTAVVTCNDKGECKVESVKTTCY
jgi:hypothetical protein